MSGWNDPYRQYQPPQQPPYYPQQPPQQQQQQQQQNPHGGVQLPPISTLAGVESILGMYPLASVTPTAHISRHLATSPTVPIGTFMRQSSSSSLSGALNMPPDPPQRQLNPIPGQGQHWPMGFPDQARVARLLEHERQQQHQRYQQQPQHHLPPRPPQPTYGPPPQQGYAQPSYSQQSREWAPSSYQTPAFASSIVERAPYASSQGYYRPPPLPAPRNPSSSSLSHALRDPTIPHPSPRWDNNASPQQQQQGHQLPPPLHLPKMQPQPHHPPPPQQQQYRLPPPPPAPTQLPPIRALPQPVKHEYPPEESKEFLDDFITQKAREMESKPHPIPQPQQTLPQPRSLPGPAAPERPSSPPRKADPEIPRRVSSPLKPVVEIPHHPIHARHIGKTPTKSNLAIQPESPDPLSMDVDARKALATPKKRKLEAMKQEDMAMRPSPSKTLKPSSSASAGSLTASGKKRMEVYIEVPPVPKGWATPNVKNITPLQHRGRTGSVFSDVTKADDVSEDELAMGSVLKSGRSSMSLGIRTGGRDERGPLEKLTELLEDIFEAEDSFPADGEVTEGQLSSFFSRLTMDNSRPLLSTSIIEKLTKAIAAVGKPSKRVRSAAGGTPAVGSAKSLVDLDVGMLSRTLKLLGRSVKLGEDLEPFAGPPAPPASAVDVKPKAKKKASKSKKPPSGGRQKSKTPSGDGDGEAAIDGEADAVEITDEDVVKVERSLQMAKESVIAANSCLALLSADKLPKQIYAEELITSCLSAIKNQFTRIIFPFAETTNVETHNQASAILMHVVREDDPRVRTCRQAIGEIFHNLSAVMPRITGLISRTDLAMSESIIIQTIYIAIGPFFSVDAPTPSSSKASEKNLSPVLQALGGSAALRALRLSSLSLIRSIFAHYPDQRSGIIEEILSSLIQVPSLKSKNGQFKLRRGKSIHTISALLMQLVQTSAHDVQVEGKRYDKARRHLLAQGSQLGANVNEEVLLSDKDREEIAMYSNGLDSPNNAAKIIIAFLTNRTGKGKQTKSTKETEYRIIFDNLLQDLLTVLYWPEWPAAGLLLGIATKYLVTALEDVKTSGAVATDSNGAKSMALDHLGAIGAQLRATALRQRRSDDGDDAMLMSLDEIVAKADLMQLDRLIAAQDEVALQLVKRSADDQAYDSARELSVTMWAQDLARTLNRCDSILSKEPESGSRESQDGKILIKIAVRIKSTLHDVWKRPTLDVFDVGPSDAEIGRLDGVAEELGTLQRLTFAQDAIVNVILSSLGAPAVFMRTKGLRALGLIIAADPDVLRKANVRQAIENHLHDLSPAVRDAAVELIGKYIIQSKELAEDYYGVISDRIADTGVSVRKRITKLLKTLYDDAADNQLRRIDICAKLVSRMSDDDDGVKDLAMKALEELWLTPESANTDASASRWSAEDRINATAAVIMGVAQQFGERQSPLEDLFHQIASSREGKDAGAVLTHYQQICNALISSLVDAQSFPGFNLVSCIKTVHLLVSAHPSIMSLANAKSLLPYLKNTATKEDQAIADYILKIFSACIPHFPKTANQFAQELQTILALRIQKPSNPLALPECIACFSAVVKCLTHDYARVVGLLKSCNGRVKSIASKPEGVKGPALRQLNIIVFMISLLCEHCDFDELRTGHPELADDIDSVSKGPVTDHVYELLLSLYDMFTDNTVRGPILRCLGYLFRAQPTLMTRPQSATMMDAVFSSSDEDAKGRLLKIMQGFLISECEKHATLQKGKPANGRVPKVVNMEELVGNTGGFAESGVSSAVIQRYLPQILDAALSTQPRIQAMAVDILGFTVRQGLAHPLQCLPVIVALETSSHTGLSTRANALHGILYTKHASLVNSRFMESARKSFEYQMAVRGKDVQGYRLDPSPTALLHMWYSHVREKRGSRQDFLKAILKCFDMDSTQISADQGQVNFVRYMAENLSALDYKTNEEVLTVIKHLTAALSVSGMQVVATWSPPLEAVMATDQSSSPSRPACGASDIPFARASVILGILLLLKAHLKTVYGLPEDKCAKWVPGKKSALGDKVATRRSTEYTLTWERMPYALKPILVADDATTQREHFLALWEADGVQAEPHDSD